MPLGSMNWQHSTKMSFDNMDIDYEMREEPQSTKVK